MNRRIVLRDAADNQIAMMDITGMVNADARAVVHLVIESLCDHGTWHLEQSFALAPWGPD